MTTTREDCVERIKTRINSPLLERLFTDGKHEEIPNEPHVFAIAAQIVLRSGYATAGALTVLEDGTLRMAQPGMVANPVAKSAPPLPIIANHYFDAGAIETIVIVDMGKHDLKAMAQPAKSTIYTG